MASSSRKDVTGHIKRLTYGCIGLVLIGLAVFRQSINGLPTSVWRRLLGVAGGLFFLYGASMYYFPKNRRRRAELDTLLDEAEDAEGGRNGGG